MKKKKLLSAEPSNYCGFPASLMLKTTQGMMEVKNPVRFGVVPTYRCNSKCPGCNRFLDIWGWPDTDVSLDNLREGYKRTQEAELTICKVRVTGGEPLLHPQYADILPLLSKTWNSWSMAHLSNRQRITIFTNGLLPIPVLANTRDWKHSPLALGKEKLDSFHPMMLSPKDLGMDGVYGWGGRRCWRVSGCGMLFDVFGFSFCIHAPAIGRVIGVDPYSSHPVTDGMQEICEHCPFSLGRKVSLVLLKMMMKKEHDFEYPTATYRAAIKRGKAYTFQKFEEREN